MYSYCLVPMELLEIQLRVFYVVWIDGKEIILLLNDLCHALNLMPLKHIDIHTQQYLIYTQLNKDNIFRKPTKSSRLGIHSLIQAHY